jgi:hypothetical protein
MIHNFPKLEIFMLAIYVNSRLNHSSGGEVRELSLTTAWWQFPALLSVPAPRVLSSNTGKQRFQIKPIVETY